MNALYIILGFVLLPIAMMMFIYIIAAIYIAWLFLLGVCGFKWAQDKIKEL